MTRLRATNLAIRAPAGPQLFLYNVLMLEKKTVRLTETVKAAG